MRETRSQSATRADLVGTRETSRKRGIIRFIGWTVIAVVLLCSAIVGVLHVYDYFANEDYKGAADHDPDAKSHSLKKHARLDLGDVIPHGRTGGLGDIVTLNTEVSSIDTATNGGSGDGDTGGILNGDVAGDEPSRVLNGDVSGAAALLPNTNENFDNGNGNPGVKGTSTGPNKDLLDPLGFPIHRVRQSPREGRPAAVFDESTDRMNEAGARMRLTYRLVKREGYVITADDEESITSIDCSTPSELTIEIDKNVPDHLLPNELQSGDFIIMSLEWECEFLDGQPVEAIRGIEDFEIVHADSETFLVILYTSEASFMDIFSEGSLHYMFDPPPESLPGLTLTDDSQTTILLGRNVTLLQNVRPCNEEYRSLGCAYACEDDQDCCVKSYEMPEELTYDKQNCIWNNNQCISSSSSEPYCIDTSCTFDFNCGDDYVCLDDHCTPTTDQSQGSGIFELQWAPATYFDLMAGGTSGQLNKIECYNCYLKFRPSHELVLKFSDNDLQQLKFSFGGQLEFRAQLNLKGSITVSHDFDDPEDRLLNEYLLLHIPTPIWGFSIKITGSVFFSVGITVTVTTDKLGPGMSYNQQAQIGTEYINGGWNDITSITGSGYQYISPDISGPMSFSVEGYGGFTFQLDVTLLWTIFEVANIQFSAMPKIMPAFEVPSSHCSSNSEVYTKLGFAIELAAVVDRVLWLGDNYNIWTMAGNAFTPFDLYSSCVSYMASWTNIGTGWCRYNNGASHEFISNPGAMTLSGCKNTCLNTQICMAISHTDTACNMYSGGPYTATTLCPACTCYNLEFSLP